MKTAALTSYAIAGSVGAPKSFYLGIDFSITWINGSLIHVSKQIATQKSQTQRIKALALTLGFPDRLHYFTVSNLDRF